MTNSTHILCEKVQALCSFSKFCHFMNRLDNKQQTGRERERCLIRHVTYREAGAICTSCDSHVTYGEAGGHGRSAKSLHVLHRTKQSNLPIHSLECLHPLKTLQKKE